MGVAHVGGGDGGVTPVEKWDDDFCEREAEAIMSTIKTFCTRKVHGFDEELFGHLKRRVLMYVSDGCRAALKTGHVLKHTSFRHMAFVIRDPAHAVRIAGRDPLHAGIPWYQIGPQDTGGR